MRQIVLDTETTGLEPAEGHRIIEIGCVELIDRRPSGRTYHQYLNPEREIDAGAEQVHGISAEFLADKPCFREAVDEFLAFVEGAELIIHNAPFDVGFINHELSLLDPARGALEGVCTITDTLALARSKHPGQKNSLDALCRRYEVDNSQRELHGALLDARILADVYLVMTGGQTSLMLGAREDRRGGSEAGIRRLGSDRPRLRVQRADEHESQAHARALQAIDKASGGQCIWRALQGRESPS